MSNQETITADQVEESEIESAANEPTDIEMTTPVEVDEDFEEEATSNEVAEGDGFSIFSLKRGQLLSGKVKNITLFGAFVDVGLAQDGLVHISELDRKKVEKVDDVVSVGQEIQVWVKKVDRKRGRISLTMVKPITRRLKDINDDDELEGIVTRLESYGAFIDLASERDGLVHISQIAHTYIQHPQDALTVGDTVKVKVLKVNRKKRQVDLSIKALLPPPVVEAEPVVEKIIPQLVVVEIPIEIVAEEEGMSTAMALAFASLQSKSQSGNRLMETGKVKGKHRQELDSIISRTLASNQ